MEGCNAKHLARGWCATHYMRVRTTGSPGTAELKRRPGDPDSPTKNCRWCKTTKPVGEFHRDKRNTDGRMSHCKVCYQAKQSQAARKRKYGLTPEQYDAEVARCGGSCPMCGESAKLVVDHDHRTGAFRSLLCDRCNRLLGVADDSVDLLQAAIDYLTCHKETTSP